MGLLVTIQGPDLGRSFALDRDATLLGRQHDSHICLSGRAVSRHHARIARNDGAFLIEDLDSSNGTYLNGQRLPPHVPTPLTERDSLQIGPYVFALRLPGASLRAEANLVVRETVSAATVTSGLLGQDATAKLQVVLNIAQQLARTLDLDQLLEKVLEQVLRLFPQADRAFAILCEGDLLSLRAQQSRRPQTDDLPFSRTIVRRALSEGVGLISDDVQSDQRFTASTTLTSLDLRSMMCVPMINLEGKPLGVIQVDRYGKGFGFTREDLQLLTAVALQVSVVVENAALHAQRLQEQRLHQEIALARDIQQGFLPDELEDFPSADFELSGLVYPARQVAGDWYDFFRTRDGKLAFFVGDVSGKGMPAALFLVAVRTLCRHLAREGLRPDQTLQALNRDLADDNPQCMFVTLIHGLYDPSRGELTLTSAGHHAPLVRRAGGAMERVPLQSGRLLGYDEPDLHLSALRLKLNPGDTLICFTDGVVEARAPASSRLFGIERLQTALADLGPQAPLRQGIKLVKRHLEAFTGSKELQDDATLLLLRRN
jgi:sigma-B regulation protein RsbU (phosphoserine phosphatase)